jgi:DNA (cytosine-5)-methyltransferase 1
MRTVTAAHRGETALIAAHLTKFHEGSTGADVRTPMPTVTANSPHGRPGGAIPLGVVAATLTKLYGTSEHGARVDAPMPTVTAGGQHLGLTAATLVQSGYGEHAKQAPRALDIAQPLGTVVAGGAKHALVSAFLTKHFGGVVEQKLTAPASTVTATDHHALTTVALSPIEHRAEVRAFLLKYYSGAEKSAKSKPAKSKRKKGDESAQGQDIRTPLHTITTRDRFALVTVDGVDYEIVDIGMRMLEPRELWRAQGFPADLDVLGFNKSKQIELCGNSVCPPVAEAIVRANFQRADGGVTHAAA